MKKLYFFAVSMLFSSLLTAQITNPAPYCASQASNNYNMWNYIKIEGTSHAFGAAGSWMNTNTYKYYNNVVFPSVTAGATMTVELMPYSVGDLEPMYFGVFIDFNNNNTFEVNELVMKNNNTINAKLPSNGQPATAITKSITIPAGTAAGNYRMRLVRGQKTGDNKYTYDNTFDVGACSPAGGNTYGCTYDFNLNITASLAVNDINQKDNSIEIYPNPVKNNLNIKNPKKEEIRKISVYSASGQLVREETVKNQGEISVDVSGLDSGVYFAKIETSLAEYSNKFIKE